MSEIFKTYLSSGTRFAYLNEVIIKMQIATNLESHLSFCMDVLSLWKFKFSKIHQLMQIFSFE